jgi:hypothetical protein
MPVGSRALGQCGYLDADDLDDLRHDPAFRLACGRLPFPLLSERRHIPGKRMLIRY